MPTTTDRRSRIRAARRAVVGPAVLTAALFGATYHAAQSTNVEDAQTIDYREECEQEGCSKEEIKELWSSYRSECYDESCWTEEVFELAGGDHYLYDPYIWASEIPDMFNAFRDRLGKKFTPAPMKLGPTDTTWSRFLAWIDGKTVTVPVAKCDANFGNCGLPEINW